MLTSLQAVATHLAIAVERLLHVRGSLVQTIQHDLPLGGEEGSLH